VLFHKLFQASPEFTDQHSTGSRTQRECMGGGCGCGGCLEFYQLFLEALERHWRCWLARTDTNTY